MDIRIVKKFLKILKIWGRATSPILIVLLIVVWLFAGWPVVWKNFKIKEAKAQGINVKVGSFAKITTTGTQTITGLGFQPKAIIFYWSRNTSNATAQVPRSQGVGFTDCTNQRAVAIAEDDNAGTSNAGRYRTESNVIVILSNGNPTVGSRATFTSCNSDGFTINWAVSEARADIINYIAIGGPDVTNVRAGTFTLAATTGIQNITGVGFRPDFVMFLWGFTENVDTASAGLEMGIGFADYNNNQGSILNCVRDNQANNSTKLSQQRTDNVVLLSDLTCAQDALAAFNGFTSDGFQLNVSDAPGAATPIFYLAIKGGSHAVGNFLQPTTTGVQTISGTGFQPNSVVLFSHNQVAGTALTAPSTFSIGAANATTSRAGVWGQSRNVDPSQTAVYTDNTKIIIMRTLTGTGGAGTINAQADFNGFTSNGFQLNWTTVDTTQRQIIYWAFGPSPTFNQSAYRWFNNWDSTDLSGFLQINPSTGDDRALSIAVDSKFMYIVGRDSEPGNFQWRIEKRSLYDGSLVYATTSNPTGSDDQPRFITIDSQFMYIVGYETVSAVTADNQWRIEKRNLSDGSLVYAVTSNPSGKGDAAYGIAVDSQFMYIVGDHFVSGTNNWQWRIEKRNLSDGSLVYATTTNYSAGDEAPFGITIDSQFMYIVGWDSNGGNQWRIEKRNLSDGSLVYTTTSDPSTGDDQAMSIAKDSQFMYIVGYDTVPGNNEWRIEKRNLSDGSLVYATTSNPTTGSDQVRFGPSLVIDSQFMYIAGWDSNGGNQWRIEKRNLSDGSLVYAVTSNPSTGDDGARAIAIDSQFMYVVGFDSAPGDYEWRIEKRNLSDGSFANGPPLADQDTAATLSSAGQTFRLRLLLHVTNKLGLNSQTFKLQFAQRGTDGSCDTNFNGETYVDVTTSTVIAFYDNPTPTDGSALTANTNDPIHGADTAVNQTYEELNPFTNSIAAINSGQDGKWDFALKDNGAPASTTYCFRVVKADGTVLETYNVIPEITTAAAPAITCSLSATSTSFSALTPSAVSNSSPDITITISSGSGFQINVKDAGNGTNPGLYKSTSPTYLIQSQDATLSAGTDGYGIQATTTNTSISINPKYNKSGNDVGGLSLTDVVLATSSIGVSSSTINVKHKASVSVSAPTGDYQDTIIYTCSAL
jgi:hypothetical protein